MVSSIHTPSPTSCSRSLSALTSHHRWPRARAMRVRLAIRSSASTPVALVAGDGVGVGHLAHARPSAPADRRARWGGWPCSRRTAPCGTSAPLPSMTTASMSRLLLAHQLQQHGGDAVQRARGLTLLVGQRRQRVERAEHVAADVDHVQNTPVRPAAGSRAGSIVSLGSFIAPDLHRPSRSGQVARGECIKLSRHGVGARLRAG